jgi:prophage regulatory protein
MVKRILRLPNVIDRVGIGRSSIYAGIAAGTFPKQIQLGARSVGWIESEINYWVAARIRESRLGNLKGPSQ